MRLRTSCRNQAHGVMGKLGIAVPMSDPFGTRGAAFLNELPLPVGYAVRLRALRTVMGELDRQLARLDQEITARPAADTGYRAIQQIGGIGPVLAAGVRRRDRRRHALPHRQTAVLVGRAHPTPPRVGPDRAPWAPHQAGLDTGALGGGRGRPTRPREHPDARSQGTNRGPPRHPGTQHRKGGRGPQALTLVYYGLRDGEVRCLARTDQA